MASGPSPSPCRADPSTSFKMQRALASVRLRALTRNGSTASARWSNIVRSESNINTPEDPPTAPLPEEHDVGEGVSDFSNWVEKHEDVSLMQALGGFSFIMATMYGIWRYSTSSAKAGTSTFTHREFPNVQNDIPTWEDASEIRRE